MSIQSATPSSVLNESGLDIINKSTNYGTFKDPESIVRCPAHPTKKRLDLANRGLKEGVYLSTYAKLCFIWLTIGLTIMSFWARSSWLLIFKLLRDHFGASQWSADDDKTFRMCFENAILMSKVITILLGFVMWKLPRRWAAIMVQCSYVIGIAGLYIGAQYKDFYWPLYITHSIWGSFLAESLNSSLWIMRYFPMTCRRMIPPLLNFAADASLALPEVYRIWLDKGILSPKHALVPTVILAFTLMIGIYFIYPSVVCHELKCHCEEIQRDQDYKEGMCSFQNVICACPHPCGEDPCQSLVRTAINNITGVGNTDIAVREGQLIQAEEEDDQVIPDERYGSDLKIKNLNYESAPYSPPYEAAPYFKKINTYIYIIAVISFSTAFTTKLNLINFEKLRFQLITGSDDAFISKWTQLSAFIVATAGIPIGVVMSLACAFVPIFWMYSLLHISFIVAVSTSIMSLRYTTGDPILWYLLVTSNVAYVLGKGFIFSGMYVLLTTYFGINDISRLMSTAYIGVLLWTKGVSYVFTPSHGNILTAAEYQHYFMKFIYVHCIVFGLVTGVAIKEGTKMSAKSIEKK